MAIGIYQRFIDTIVLTARIIYIYIYMMFRANNRKGIKASHLCPCEKKAYLIAAKKCGNLFISRCHCTASVIDSFFKLEMEMATTIDKLNAYSILSYTSFLWRLWYFTTGNTTYFLSHNNYQGPISIALVNFDISIDKYLNSFGWHYVSIS